jgi:hypothetical protein
MGRILGLREAFSLSWTRLIESHRGKIVLFETTEFSRLVKSRTYIVMLQWKSKDDHRPTSSSRLIPPVDVNPRDTLCLALSPRDYHC